MPELPEVEVVRAGLAPAVVGARITAVDVIDERGSFSAYIWSFEPDAPHREPGSQSPIPSTSPASVALAKDLKRRGFTFVGPTTAYAFMQAMGLVNDHIDGCHVRHQLGTVPR